MHYESESFPAHLSPRHYLTVESMNVQSTFIGNANNCNVKDWLVQLVLFIIGSLTHEYRKGFIWSYIFYGLEPIWNCGDLKSSVFNQLYEKTYSVFFFVLAVYEGGFFCFVLFRLFFLAVIMPSLSLHPKNSRSITKLCKWIVTKKFFNIPSLSKIYESFN